MHHQELLKSSAPPYSNGLEQIYAFETVDARSVRKMASPLRDTSHASEETENTTPRFKKTNTRTQLTFDLGSDYSFGLPHIALREPIEALKLSSATNRVLHSLGKKTSQMSISLFINTVRIAASILVYLKNYVRKSSIGWALSTQLNFKTEYAGKVFSGIAFKNYLLNFELF